MMCCGGDVSSYGTDLAGIFSLLSLHCWLLLQPAILFVGERFDSDQDFKLAKSMLLDMFRGQQVRAASGSVADS
jgi:hypothetical protein